MSLIVKVDTLADLLEAIENLQVGIRIRVVDQTSAQYAVGAVSFDAAGMTLALPIDTTKPL